MGKEFMLYIKNSGDAKKALSEEQHFSFIKKCETYIEKLKLNGNLIAAQPLVRKGVILTRCEEHWNRNAIEDTHEMNVGYYHIIAENEEEAIEIAKRNPEFEYVPSAVIEIRPIKVREEKTEYVYPK